MLSFLIRTDVHISDRPPESRCDDYMETVLQKLRQIGALAKKRSVTAVLDNGDFFHHKAATRNSHLLVRKVADLHREHYPCPVYENPGNHDFPYGNVDYVHKQPLQVLFSTGIFERMTEVRFEDDSGLKVRVVGFPYKPDYEVFDFDIERGDEDVLIAAVHDYASPEGGDIFVNETAFSYTDLAECTPDIFVLGHWHIDQGIQTVDDTIFFNLGSLTRGSLVQDNLERVPRIGYLKIDKSDEKVQIETEAIEIEVLPAEEVFDLETHNRIKEERKDIDEFIQTLVRSATVDEDDDVTKAVQNLEGFDDEVRDRALRYLEQVS